MYKSKEIKNELETIEIKLIGKMSDYFLSLTHDFAWVKDDIEKINKRLDRIEELLEEKVNE